MIVRDIDVLQELSKRRRRDGLHQRADASTTTRGARSNREPRIRCSGCAR